MFAMERGKKTEIILNQNSCLVKLTRYNICTVNRRIKISVKKKNDDVENSLV